MSKTTETHRATLGGILTLTTGKMVAQMDEWYALQDFLAGRSLMTHERALAFESQRDALLAQFPRLAEAEVPAGTDTPDACREWVASVACHVGWTEADVTYVPGCDVDPAEALERVLGRP